MANEYARAFAERAQELNEHRLAGGTLGAEVRVARDAVPPRPWAGRPLLYGILACFVGLLLGGVMALALEGRTRRWRGAKDGELTLRAPVLGVIPDHRPEKGGRLR